MSRSVQTITAAAALLVLSAGCSPRVGVEVPDKPITINLNVKIDHDIRVRVEKDLDEVIDPKSELF